MIRIAICDDMSRDRQELRSILERELVKRDVSAVCFEYESGEAFLEEKDSTIAGFQLIFLDIYMADLNGLEVARRLRDGGCLATIIFLTVTPDFAPEGYEVEAAGYLLKPLNRDKLCRRLEHFLERESHNMLTLRSGANIFNVPMADILYIESNRNVLTIHTTKENIPFYGRLNDIALQLPSHAFLRCHQSFLVNMDRVFAVKDSFCMENGEEVPIRVRERKAVRETYFRYITEKIK